MYVEQLKSGDKFSKLKKTITINILDYNFIQNKEYHNCFHLLEDTKGIKLTDVIEIHFLEMSKLHGHSSIDVEDTLTQWMMFLDFDSKGELEMLAKKNNEIKKAYDVLQVISKDADARALYLAREMALHDEATRIEEAKERGKAEGKSELLINQLEKKFKELPNIYRENIKDLPEETIDKIATDIFDMKNLDELKRYFVK